MIARRLCSSTWFHEDDPGLGFMNTFSKSINKIETAFPGLLPDLRHGGAVLVGSDYAGFHKGARYEVLAFAVTNLTAVAAWDIHRCSVRRRWLSDGRRISYKALHDGRRRQALLPFLESSNQIRGLLFVVVIDRTIQSLFRKHGRLQMGSPDLERLRGRSAATAERTLRVIHVASLLLRGLIGVGQDVLWFTDEDEIVANETRLREFVGLFARVSNHYLTHPVGHLRIGTTRSDTGCRDIEDFVALCDIAAGALQDAFSHGVSQLLLAPSLTIPRPIDNPAKSTQVMDWFSDNTQPLKRLVYVIDEPTHSGRLRLTHIRFHGSND